MIPKTIIERTDLLEHINNTYANNLFEGNAKFDKCMHQEVVSPNFKIDDIELYFTILGINDKTDKCILFHINLIDENCKMYGMTFEINVDEKYHHNYGKQKDIITKALNLCFKMIKDIYDSLANYREIYNKYKHTVDEVCYIIKGAWHSPQRFEDEYYNGIEYFNWDKTRSVYFN